MIFHFPGWNPLLQDIPLVRNGAAMVDVFFVLSGFVICRIYGETIRRPRDLLRFQLLRFGRLYPVHLLFLAIFLGLEAVKLALDSTGLLAAQVAAFTTNDFTMLMANLSLTHALGPDEWIGAFNGPSWTISVEFWCYLVFASLVMTLGASRKLILPAIAALGLINLAWPMIGNEQIIRCWAGFFLGCVAAELCRGKTGATWPAWAQVAIAAALIAWLWLKPRELEALAGVLLLTAVLIIALVNGADGPVGRILRTAPLLWLGKISYSLYMAHYLAIYVAAQLLMRFSPHSRGGGAIPELPLVEALAVYAVLLAAILGLSWLTWRWIEKPCRAMSRQLIFARMGRFEDAPLDGGLKSAPKGVKS